MFRMCYGPVGSGGRQVCAHRNLFGGAWMKRLRERRAQRTQHLREELDKSYVSELKEFRKNQGKRFHAEEQLLPRDRTIQFPEVTGCTLSGDSLQLPLPHTNLVLVSMKNLGMRACDQYRKTMEEEFDGKVAIVELSLLEKGVLTLLHRWVRSNLQKSIPLNRHAQFIFFSGAIASQLREALRIHSSIVGHAYLLDKNGYIRWRAHATPTQQELQYLIKCTKELLYDH